MYLGESIAPYRLLEPVQAVIPIRPHSKGVLDARAAAAAGYGRLSALLADAETIWRSNSKQARTFVEQIDFFGNLSGQFPLAALRVVYTKTGTNLAAAVLRDETAVVENGLYWAATASEAEAYYLAASCTAPGSLDTRLLLSGGPRDSLMPGGLASPGLRRPFFSISHSAL